MGDVIWSIFSNPRSIAGPSDVPFIFGAALTVALLTLAFMSTLGNRIIQVSKALAMISGALFVPLLMIVIALALLWSAPSGAPPNDGPGMLFMGILVLSICALPISLIASVIYVVRRRRHCVG